MQLFLQPITEQYCERISSKRARGEDFACRLDIVTVGKGCELRSVSNSFAS